MLIIQIPILFFVGACALILGLPLLFVVMRIMFYRYQYRLLETQQQTNLSQLASGDDQFERSEEDGATYYRRPLR